ncbi:MAG: glycosyltransferase family 39 protein [Phycisphaeraceae bacterium]|nr:glycosyltransferase family 39 protein [Phycisphaeraceae bacterium]
MRSVVASALSGVYCPAMMGNAVDNPRGRSRWCAGIRGGVSLLAVCLAVYLPGLFVLPPIDRDEARFAQATRQMAESGDWVVPRVQDRPRLNKPPLIYWVQGAGIRLFGDPPPPSPSPAPPAPPAPGSVGASEPFLGNIWVFRLPSVLSAIGSVFLTWRIGLSMFGRSRLPHGGSALAAWLAGAFLAVSPIVAWEAHQARADQLLLFLTTAAMGAMWIVWRRVPPAPARNGHEGSARDPVLPPSSLRAFVPPSLFWLCLSLAILTKGPIAPMIAGLTALTLCVVTRRWKWLLELRPLLGALIVLAVAAPWVVLVGERVGWETYLRTVLDETIGRSAGAKEGHWGPPGYHLILVTVLLWPGSILTALGVRHAWRRMRGKDHPNGVDRAGIGPETLEMAIPTDTAADAEPLPGTWSSLPGTLSGGKGTLTGLKETLTGLKETLTGHKETLTDAKTTLTGVKTTLTGVKTTLTDVKETLTDPPEPGIGTTGHPRTGWLVGRVASARAASFPSSSPPPETFLLAWVVPAWIVFELVSTKLPHYTMPLFPALALLSARAVVLAEAGALVGLQERLTRIGLWIWRLLAVVLSMPTVFMVWRSIARGKHVAASLWAMLGWVITFAVVVQFVLPRAADGSARIEQAQRAIDPTLARPFASVGYHEDSLVFLTRGRVVKLDAIDLPAWTAANPTGLVLIDAAIAEANADALRAIGLERVAGAAKIDVFNYSNGRRHSLEWFETTARAPVIEGGR